MRGLLLSLLLVLWALPASGQRVCNAVATTSCAADANCGMQEGMQHSVTGTTFTLHAFDPDDTASKEGNFDGGGSTTITFMASGYPNLPVGATDTTVAKVEWNSSSIARITNGGPRNQDQGTFCAMSIIRLGSDSNPIHATNRKLKTIEFDNTCGGCTLSSQFQCQFPDYTQGLNEKWECHDQGGGNWYPSFDFKDFRDSWVRQEICCDFEVATSYDCRGRLTNLNTREQKPLDSPNGPTAQDLASFNFWNPHTDRQNDSQGQALRSIWWYGARNYEVSTVDTTYWPPSWCEKEGTTAPGC